jgi:WD40 repeat protein
VSGSSDATARVWDLDAKVQLAVLSNFPATVSRDTSDASLATLVRDASETARRRGVHAVIAVAVTRDGRRVLTQGYDWAVRIWDLESRRCVETLRGRYDLQAVAIGPPDYPVRGFSRGGVGGYTVVVRGESDTEIAWYPAALDAIATGPGGRTWAGVSGRRVHIFRLEGSA